MAKESTLYQLMKVRMNGIINGITNSDGEYQKIIQKSYEYSGSAKNIIESMENINVLFHVRTHPLRIPMPN